MDLYGLIGYPLGHSFSKQYFTEKFERDGITDTKYINFPLKEIGGFKELIGKTPGLKGLNITIPYKRAVLQYLDDIAALPAGVHACNCVKILDGRTYGYNTDIKGFENALIPQLTQRQNKALILGNGGAAESVKYVFNKHHIDFKIVSRTRHEVTAYTYQDLDPTILSTHLIIVNTTPLGMHPNEENCPDIPYNAISAEHYLFDMIYNPAETLFLKKGAAQGATIQNGYDMLCIQAEESWKIWNNP